MVETSLYTNFMGCQRAAEELISGYKITLCYKRQMQFSASPTGLNKNTSVVEHWLQGREYELKITAMNDAGIYWLYATQG